ncbi:MAG: ATP-dependent RecD-like DNA helicase, partial [Mollicutes bacterium]|nr:ATP-dependent RecD-like DNA helicase [Mollicutes bacterium]
IETNKTITFTGYFSELSKDIIYRFEGEYIFHNRYGYQFQVSNYEIVTPEEQDAIMEFLTSNFIKGCGAKTAEKIIELFGTDALNKIKENKQNLLLVPKMTEKRANKIYESIIKYYNVNDNIIYLQNLGFTIKEAMKLINIYDQGINDIIADNIYLLTDLVDFKKLDQIFLSDNNYEDERRIEACIIQTMKSLTFSSGDIYLDKIEIVEYIAKNYKIYTRIDETLEKLYLNKKIIIVNNDYYLIEDYLDEINNATAIYNLINSKMKKIGDLDKYLKIISEKIDVKYNEEQILAIKRALTNNISIITGGPGTGKTTIINGIINAYAAINNITFDNLPKEILLLAPTGRAAKRMSETTAMPASTIHRFLKWDQERNIFGVNEFNKLHYNLIIVDETSMIDNHLLSSLFKGLDLHNTQILFVGDEYQLPSVGPGLVLNDMINCEVITHTRLEYIYRQSDNSFIPVLAKEIKEVNLTSDLLSKKDDYNFIETSSSDIKNVIKQILNKCLEKKIDATQLQVLAPMYKGENGIDNLNVLLQNIFNPAKKNKRELSYFGITYREGDKVLNLVNNIDENIYNGDIGYIEEIDLENKEIVINYDGNKVSNKKEDLSTITHAYAISIHKSQGSEFNHVIIPITLNYNRMLYNKLLYTGVSRAKKSLVLIGSIKALEMATLNNFSKIRKTSLKQRILYNLNISG